MVTNHESGIWGEELAAKFLRKKGFRIVQTRYRSRYGEIDIIASKDRILAFVEVKMRKSDRYGQAMEFVDERKQARLITTASFYLSENPTKLQPRFDIIEIYAPNGVLTSKPIINHLEDAFE